MKLFIIGASGLVGGAVAQVAAREGHEVTGAVGSFAGTVPGVTRQLTLDLLDERATVAAIRSASPDVIVNGAAVSETAQVDADPKRSHALNAELPAMLARVSQEMGARFVHFSSEQVFDGTKPTPYRIDDDVATINLYAEQKVASEQAVHAAAPKLAVTLRAPLLMGNSPSGRRSLHERLLADWAAGRTPKLYTDEFRQPCTAANLAEAVLELCLRRDVCGVFHWAGDELLSRFELGQRLRAHFQLSERVAPIQPVTRAETPEAAKKRQACLGLDLAPLTSVLRTRPQTFAEQLTELVVPPPCAAWYAQAKLSRT